MAIRTRQIDKLIVNSPFEEPARFWSYDREHRIHTRHDGRRPAGYQIATEGGGFDDPGRFIEFELVNRIRERVKTWREEEYPGVTGVTRRLLDHWRDPEQREGHRFFFCQLEAIETLIWLTEAAPADRQGITIPGDGGPFERWCCKLATGTGKTVVMAMLLAWQFANKAAFPKDARFSKNALVVAPGLTVRSRLAVLVPESDGNYYDEFNIIPPGLHEAVRGGRVLVRNRHALDWETPEKLAKKRTVDLRQRTPKSDRAYAAEVLAELGSARNLIVVNDEAHHAWRLPEGAKVKGVSKAERENATKWVGALDRIHRTRGVLRCFDFSATPYAPTGRKSDAETLFGWIVSDFGLNDAIEAGLVKTPRVVIRDDGRLGSDYRSRFFHLYMAPEVKEDLNRKAEPHEPLPQLVTNAYDLLGKDWLAAKREWEANGSPVPPVMITVCNSTETAARIKHAFDRGKVHIDELCDPSRTLHIDSKVLETAEEQDEPIAIGGTDAEDEEAGGDEETDAGEEEAGGPKRTKKQQAELLRRTVDTVGQVGKPGEQVQNVISVGMLSEGWDAKTVTHVMGLRAFSSQLLCEQVVGRGLRRTSYELTEEGLFPPEYVNIFGVPFTFLPHEGGEGAPPPPPTPKTRVEALPEREAEFAIEWPNVLRVQNVFLPRLSLDVAKLPALELDATDVATVAELAQVVEGKPVSQLSEIDLKDLADRFRLQRVVFEVARDVYEQMAPTWHGNKEVLLAQVIRIVEAVLRSDRVRFRQSLFNDDPLRRRVALALQMGKVVHHLWKGIRESSTDRLELVLDKERPVMSTSDMRPWFTGRPNEHTRRSHVNVVVYDSTWEASEAYRLEKSEHVAAWVKNDHLGFAVRYVYQGVVKSYCPDFLIRLTDGSMLVLEVKGQDSPENKAKRDALDEWCRAVTADGGYGAWSWAVSFNPGDVDDILANRVGATVARTAVSSTG